ncbi:MAG: hypothetical protein ACTSRL_22230, partial [Candidatus Helarchaeota archaeon]
LNDILVKGGGKVIKSLVPDQPVTIELHTEFFYKDYNLIVYYIRFFKDFCNGLKRDVNFDFPFQLQACSNRPPKLVKMV